jgi:outer membrane cobalamin receptor
MNGRTILLHLRASIHVLTLWPCALIGQIQGDLPDTSRSPWTRPVVLDEMEVTATKIPQAASMATSPVTIITRAKMDQFGYATLDKALSSAAGLYVKDYGAASGIKTISQRGLGAEHTVVLLNGMRLARPQNGTVDLGMVPLEAVQSVEVVTGGQSGLYGADAIAGVVNLVTFSPQGLHTTTKASADWGPNGSQQYRIHSAYSNQGVSVLGGFTVLESPGDYSFEMPFNGVLYELKRQNADLASRSAYLQASVAPNETDEFGFYGHTVSSWRGVSGVLVSPLSTSVARQDDSEDFAQLSWKTHPSKQIAVTTCAQGGYSHERYWDPALVVGGAMVDNYAKTLDLRIESRIDQVFTRAIRSSAGIEMVRTIGEGNSLAEEVVRSQGSAFAAAEIRSEFDDSPVTALTVIPMIRCDMTSGMAAAVSPQCGALVTFSQVNLGVVEDLRPALRFSISRNYRVPTFNELYYAGGGGRGNPALAPEHSISLEAGVSLAFTTLGSQRVHCSVFRQDLRDRILWTPAGPGIVMPKNARRVRSTGFEVKYEWVPFADLLSLEWNYTRLSSIKCAEDFPGDPNVGMQLIYVPQEMFNATLSMSVGVDHGIIRALGFSMQEQFVGFRFASEDGKEFLPSYNIVSLSGNVRLQVWSIPVGLRLLVNNLLNVRYEVMRAYPMPHRTFQVSANIEL